jgi:hypothetical protein
MDALEKKKAGETDILSFDYGVCTRIGKQQQK